MQLLAIKTVLAHHFIDELFGRRVIREVAAHLHHIVLRLKQKPAGRLLQADRRISAGNSAA